MWFIEKFQVYFQTVRITFVLEGCVFDCVLSKAFEHSCVWKSHFTNFVLENYPTVHSYIKRDRTYQF